MMKKFLFSILAILTFCLCFTACGDSKITVTFDGNGGVTEDGETSVVWQIDPANFTTPTFYRDGYIFDGWSEDIKLLNKDATVKAKWKAITYSVTFDEKGGTLVSGNLNQQTTEGKVTLPTVKRTYYEFLGWYNGDDKVDENTLYTKDTTLVARWQIKKVTIKFVDTVYKNTCKDKVIASGEKLGELPVLDDKTGDYTFIGWYYLDGNKKITVTSETILQIDKTELTLYANWRSNWTPFY